MNYAAAMSIIARALVAIVALIHVYIAVLEMALWTSRGPEVFDTFPADLFEQTTEMAFNQGAYNGVLAAGLFWSIFIGDRDWQRNVATFFLLAVAAMGVVGALTINASPLFAQTIPASLALLAVYLTKRPERVTTTRFG